LSLTSLDEPWRLIDEKGDVLIEKLKLFLEKTLRDSGKDGFTLGLSGGLDSSTLAVLLRKSLGKDRVLALILPDKDTPLEDIKDAVSLAESFDIRYLVIDISPIIDSFLYVLGQSRDSVDKIVLGNIKARVRMTIIYYYANYMNLLVAATSNRTEYLLGYFTKWGDIAGDVYPLLNLYKTQVRILARKLGLPEKIITKPSSPGFWPGHKSEEEIGAPFEIIDKVLYLAIDKQLSLQEIADVLGVDREIVNNIWERVMKNQHKRKIIAPPAYSFMFMENIENLLRSIEKKEVG